MSSAEHGLDDKGLAVNTAGLPAHWYYDTDHYRRELRAIWYRQWVYVARSSEVSGARAFRAVALGDQQLLLVRDETGTLRGFHNTCRHRGAALCRESAGRLARAVIVCPYHAWVYGLDGALQRTTSKRHARGFEVADHPLYPVGVREWNGFVFVTLADSAPPLELSFDQAPARFDAWHLGELVVGHEFIKEIGCNWKVFWENYNECLHCPGVHPQLSRLVPIFGRGLLEERDDPDWRAHASDPDPKFKGGLRAGAVTWSMNGLASAAPFADLDANDREAAHVYLTSLPSMFIVGHVDYVRVVRLLPLGPERTELRIEYLFSPATLASPGFDLANIVGFTNLVMSEDAEVCELNQRGLHALPHAQGVLMPEEYLIEELHAWIRRQLGTPPRESRPGP
jgi:Rieske 2Fe-2S family protein